MNTYVLKPSEKQCDRKTAAETLKAIVALWSRIAKQITTRFRSRP